MTRAAATAATATHGRSATSVPPQLLAFEHVTKHHRVRGRFPFAPHRQVHAVDDVSLSIAVGETVAIVGESGCGKSSLGRLAVALDRPTRGVVRFDGDDLAALDRRDLRRRRRDLQLVFQDPSAALDPRMTVGASIREPLAIQRRGSPAAQRERVAELLTDVGLSPDLARRHPHELSGGMRQRVGIARALALDPRFIVADEPVSGLDVSVRAQVLNLLRDVQRRHDLTYLVITHDLTTVRNVADRLAVMYLGHIVEVGPTTSTYACPAHPYTAALLMAVPDPLVPDERAGPAVVGEVPSAIDPPAGCRFRTRCPRATAVCADVDPPLEPIGPSRWVACHHPIHGGED